MKVKKIIDVIFTTVITVIVVFSISLFLSCDCDMKKVKNSLINFYTSMNLDISTPTLQNVDLDSRTFNETGQCGNNSHWKRSSDGEVIVIYGNGELWNKSIFDGITKNEPEKGIRFVVFDEGITKIRSETISGFIDLECVFLPSTLESIDSGALNFCDNLYSISFPNGNNEYEVVDSVLYSENGKKLLKYPDAKKGTTFKIPESVTTIESYAFSNLKFLKKITIPENVLKLCDRTFALNSEALTEVIISDGVKDLGNALFYGCQNLKKVVLPSKIEKIPAYSFWQCSSLSEITIPDGVYSIGYMSFAECKELVKMVIPESVREIEGLAFWKCESLNEIILPKNLKTIGKNEKLCTNQRVFSDCISLKKIIIPSGVSINASYVFKGWNENQTIYFCDSKPGFDWNDNWSEGCNAKLIWNYKKRKVD